MPRLAATVHLCVPVDSSAGCGMRAARGSCSGVSGASITASSWSKHGALSSARVCDAASGPKIRFWSRYFETMVKAWPPVCAGDLQAVLGASGPQDLPHGEPVRAEPLPGECSAGWSATWSTCDPPPSKFVNSSKTCQMGSLCMLFNHPVDASRITPIGCKPNS